VKYLYREYDPSMGRWLSRDPMEEDGGENLLAFVLNSPIRRHDSLGANVADDTTSPPLPPVDPTAPPDDDTSEPSDLKWAKNVLKTYPSYLKGVAGGLNGTAAAIKAAAMNGFWQIGYGVAANKLGNAMKPVAQRLNLCDAYRHVRFEDSENDVMKSNWYTKATTPQGKANILILLR
jgi:hypothetical protein